MLIILGQQKSNKPIGRVAEYCPPCNEIRPFRISQKRTYWHLYYIPLQKPRVEGHMRRCEHCGAETSCEPEEYRFIDPGKRISLNALIENTNPEVEQRLIERLEMQDRAARGEATPRERMIVLTEPFLAIEGPVAKRASAVHFDMRSTLWLLVFVFLPWPLVITAANAPQMAAADVMLYCGGTIAVVSIVNVIVAFASDVRRFIARRYGAFLRESLLEMEPSEEELMQVLARLRRQDAVVARKIRPSWLHALIFGPAGKTRNKFRREDEPGFAPPRFVQE